MDLNGLKTYLISCLANCEDYLVTFTKQKSKKYATAFNCKTDELPLLMNNKWVAQRILGKELTDPSCCIEALCDEEMSYDEYKNLGENDGQLYMLHAIFEKLEMPEEARRAMASVYSE